MMDADFDLFRIHIRRSVHAKTKPFPLSYATPKKQFKSISAMAKPQKPEAVFKIASYLKTTAEIKNAMVYLAKHSKGLDDEIQLIDEQDATLSISDFDDKIDQMRLNNERTNARKMIHFIVSFPTGSSLSDNELNNFSKEYMQPFAQNGYDYVFVAHTHQSHQHIHVLLNLSNGIDRLRFGKAEIVMMRQHQVEIARKFNLDLQATRFQDRDFSLSGITIKRKHKTLLERQVPNWYAARQNENKNDPVKEYDIDEQAQNALSEWSKGFDNPKRAEQLFVEMYTEKPKTALWYANNRAEVFGVISKTITSIVLTKCELKAIKTLEKPLVQNIQKTFDRLR